VGGERPELIILVLCTGEGATIDAVVTQYLKTFKADMGSTASFHTGHTGQEDMIAGTDIVTYSIWKGNAVTIDQV